MVDRTILVVVDLASTESQPVVERAAWLAQRCSADLELFAVVYDSGVNTGEGSKDAASDTRAEILALRRQQIDALADTLRARGLTVDADVAWGHPLGEEIVRKVVASAPWLVAKDTQYLNLVQRTLLTNTDWHLIRNCPVPLLLVKPRAVSARPLVLAALDPLHQHDKPAHLDDAIFKFAEALARDTGGALHVGHAFAMPMGLELPPHATELVASQHREAMASFLSTHEVPSANLHLLEGEADQCLKKLAEDQRADFVVMGAVSRRGLKRLFIGSTAERVLDRLPCDLVIIKPAGFRVFEES